MRRSRADRTSAAGSNQVLATGTAAALDQPFTVGVVVVGELFAFANRARRTDPDRAVVYVHVAVRFAGVVDEAGVVPADPGVDHRAIGQLEAPDVPVLDVACLAFEAHLVRNL